MTKLLSLLLIATLINSCTSPVKKLSKVYNTDPVAVAKFCHDKFPCADGVSDTVTKTEYNYVEVKCDNDTIATNDTIFINNKSKTYTIYKSKFIATPKEVTIITKYIKDSAEAVSLKGQLEESKNKATKLYDKLVNKINWINWLLIALLISLFVNILFITNKR